MKLDAIEVKNKLNLSVGATQVEVIITNNPITERGHIFETDGLFLITFNAAKINNEKELNEFIKYVRGRIYGITTPVSIEHSKTERAVNKLPVVVQKKRGRKQKIELILPPVVPNSLESPKIIVVGKRGRPAGSKNKNK